MITIKNFQRAAWNRFFQTELDELLSEYSFIRHGVSVNFKATNADSFIKTRHARGLYDLHDTLKISISIVSPNSESASAKDEFENIELAAIPVLTDDGFIVNGCKYGIVSSLLPASGWYLSYRVAPNGERIPQLSLKSGSNPKLVFEYRKGVMSLKGIKSDDDTDIYTFLKAVSPSLSFSDILDKFSETPLMTALYLQNLDKEQTIDKCTQKVLKSMGPSYSYGKKEEATSFLRKIIFETNALRIGPQRKPRFKNFMSFTKATGCTLAESINLNGKFIPEGTVLTLTMIRMLDESEIDTIRIYHHDQVCKLYKIQVQDNITFEEIVNAIHHFCLFCEGLGQTDNLDHYVNKCLATIADDIRKFIEDKLKVLVKELQANIDVNVKQVDAIATPAIISRREDIIEYQKRVIKSPMFQLLDETNSLSAFSQSFKINRGEAKNMPAGARDVQKSQYGRVCPFTTSESEKVGLNLSLGLMSQIDDYGFICTPVYKVVNGKREDEIIYQSAIDERGKIIAPPEIKLDEYGLNDLIIGCRLNGELIDVQLSEINFQSVSPLQVVGPLVANIPFVEGNAGKRVNMGVSTQQQALPVYKRERSWVSTGMEALSDIGITRGRDIIASALPADFNKSDIPEDVTLTLIGLEQHNNISVLKFTSNHPEIYHPFDYSISCMGATPKGAVKHARVNLKETKDGTVTYSLDDIVVYANDVDISEYNLDSDTICFGNMQVESKRNANHAVSIGNNVKVLFKSHEGYGYEDSIQVSEGFASKYGLAVLMAKEIKVECKENETFAYNSAQTTVIPYMQPNGLPKIGTYLRAGQDVICRVEMDMTDKDNPKVKRWPTTKISVKNQGFVISASLSADKKRASVVIGDITILSEGDKLSGLHGNKGTVGQIIPDHRMPYDEDGVIPDIILNPLGVLSRNNLGQEVEALKSACGETQNTVQILPAFSKTNLNTIIDQAKSLNIVEKTIYDGRTGRAFPKKALIGTMYFMRLEHTSTSKYKACSTGDSDVNLRTMQVNKSGGAQRISELSSWCLASYGADHLADTLFTIQSDNIVNKSILKSKIQKGELIDENLEYSSNNLKMLQAYFRLLGVNIIRDGKGLSLNNLTSEDIRNLANGDCDINYGDVKTSVDAYYMIRDPEVFGVYRDTNYDMEISSREYYGRLPLKCEVIMPLFVTQSALLNLIFYKNAQTGEIKKLSRESISTVISGEKGIIGYDEIVLGDASFDERAFAYLKKLGWDETQRLQIPVIGKLVPNQHQPKFISDVVNLFKTYNIFSSVYALLMTFDSETLETILDESSVVANVNESLQETLGLFNRIIKFSKEQKLSDYVVDAIAIPPIGFRPKFGDKPATAMEAQIHPVITAIRDIRRLSPDTALWYKGVQNIYNTLLAMIREESGTNQNRTVIRELSDHSNKSSVIRDNLEAKRVTYSGRSVISVNSRLKLGQVGVPISIASTIFEDHIICELRKGGYTKTSSIIPNIGKANANKLRKLITYLSNRNISGFADMIPANRDIYSEFVACKHELEEIITRLFAKYPAILNREPSLHKFSVSGFQAVVVDSYSIQLPPLACKPYNADYDGDQMGVYFPQHPAGIKDVVEKMLLENNLINPKDGELIIALNQDIILGLYYCTMYKDNLLHNTDPEIKRVYNMNHVGSSWEYCDEFTPIGLEAMIDELKLGTLEFHETVVVKYQDRYFKNTAGRILVNAMIPDALGFTSMRSLNVTSSQIKSMSLEEKRIYEELMSLRNKMITDCEFLVDDSKLYENPRYKFIYDRFGESIGQTPVYCLRVDTLMRKGTVKNLTDIVNKWFEDYDYGKDCHGDKFSYFLDRVKALGFYCADQSGVTLSLYDFIRLPVPGIVDPAMEKVKQTTDAIQDFYNKGMITEEERREQNIQAWVNFRQSVMADIKTTFNGGEGKKYKFIFERNDNIFMIVDSGARGDVNQLMEIAGIIGNVTDANGEMQESPIRSGYMKGLNVGEAFANSYTARKALKAAQLSTGEAGELTRELIYGAEHIHIRDSDEFCGADPARIILEYNAELREGIGTKFVIDEDKLTLDIWDNPSIKAEFETKYNFPWDPQQQMDDYINFMRQAKPLLKLSLVSLELKHLLSLNRIPYIVIDDGDRLRLSQINYKLSSITYNLLLYRVIDLSKLPEHISDILIRCGESVIGEVLSPDLTPGSRRYDYCVIGPNMLSTIERLNLDEIHIWTILGCKSTEGICKKCFGIKYESKRFPENKEYVGYQSVQSIGEPLAQLVLDAHKREDNGGDGSGMQRLSRLMRNPGEHRGKRATISLYDGIVNYKLQSDSITESDGKSDEETTVGIQLSDIERLRVFPGKPVSAGDVLVAGTVSYSEVAELSGFLSAQVRLLRDYVEIFSQEKILARNFEPLARAQSEFGIASLSKGEFQKGNIYPITKLIAGNVMYTPVIVSSNKAMDYSGKILAGIAHSNLSRRIVFHTVNKTMNDNNSNIGRALASDLKTRPLGDQVVGAITKNVKMVFNRPAPVRNYVGNSSSSNNKFGFRTYEFSSQATRPSPQPNLTDFFKSEIKHDDVVITNDFLDMGEEDLLQPATIEKTQFFKGE